METVRKVILENLPNGYEEGIQYGMIGYYVPFSRLAKTYNDQPLNYAALASQKYYMSLYLNTIYSDPKIEKWFTSEYKKTGKKIYMGKSCVRFMSVDDLPLELIGQVIAKTPVNLFVKKYKQSRSRRR